MRISRAGTSNKIRSARLWNRNPDSGFTLIELTVVLLILSVIIGLVLPKIGNAVYSSDLKHSIRQIRAILSVARSNATMERIPRRVACDIPKGEIRIEREISEDGDGQSIIHYEKDNSILIQTYKFPKGIRIEDVITETGDKELDGVAYLRIGTNGMIAGNIMHLMKGDEKYTLFINPLTGNTTIEEGYLEEYKVETNNRS